MTRRWFVALGGLAVTATGVLAALALSQGPLEPRPATLRVVLPADAPLEIDDTRTTQTGPERLFITPPLAPGKVYHYTLRTVREGVAREQVVEVQGGRETHVDLRRAEKAPAADAGPPAGEPAGGASVEALKKLYRRPDAVPQSKNNELTPEREILGRTLFFDPRLSGSNWISCASCHNPALAWGDGLPRAIGHGMKELGRRTPTVLNLAWAEALFWDGRAGSLEEQALGPIAAAGEMNLPLEDLEARLRSITGYRPLFEAAYPGEPVSKETVAKAIAAFERTVVSASAPFDRWVAGEEGALGEPARRGFALFNGKANCAKCHSGWRFTDDGFHDLGMEGSDRGRGKILEDIQASQFAFKTPTLRNVDRRAPYMHDGSLATLEAVVDYYDRGGTVKRPSLSREMHALNLTAEEKADLIAFLKALTSDDKPVVVPTLPH